MVEGSVQFREAEEATSTPSTSVSSAGMVTTDDRLAPTVPDVAIDLVGDLS